MSPDKYSPISCHNYDRMEELAVKKVFCKIVFLDEDLKTKTAEGFISDFKTKNKEEFLILSSDLSIRLDKIVSVNDIDMI